MNTVVDTFEFGLFLTWLFLELSFLSSDLLLVCRLA